MLLESMIGVLGTAKNFQNGTQLKEMTVPGNVIHLIILAKKESGAKL